MNKSCRSGLSLVEILISMLIFSLLTTGLANLFFTTKRLSAFYRFRITAAELGRHFLDRLQMEVREDEIDKVNSLANNPLPNNLLSFDFPPSSPRNYKASNLPVGAGEFPQYAAYQSVTAAEEAGFEEPNNIITYYPVYSITNKDGVRKVRLAVCWIEPN
ncbi:prepilin-type N-terminal cleavage/methylation domain-containing protein [Candidatus Omnitrophota bacterium]